MLDPPTYGANFKLFLLVLHSSFYYVFLFDCRLVLPLPSRFFSWLLCGTRHYSPAWGCGKQTMWVVGHQAFKLASAILIDFLISKCAVFFGQTILCNGDLMKPSQVQVCSTCWYANSRDMFISVPPTTTHIYSGLWSFCLMLLFLVHDGKLMGMMHSRDEEREKRVLYGTTWLEKGAEQRQFGWAKKSCC